MERLCKLIDQLLDVSRISAGRIELQMETGDLRAVVREEAGRLFEEAARNGCQITFEEGGPVPADFDSLRIEQVVANLVGNAIKYGRGKPIAVAVRKDAVKVRIEVRDQGIGVAPEHQQRIFERFTRAVSVREYGGLGLGLYISRQIVVAHGGSINVRSAPGSGANFVVELPVEQIPQELEPARA